MYFCGSCRAESRSSRVDAALAALALHRFARPLRGLGAMWQRPRPSPLHPQIPGCDTAYCRFEMVAGEDWQLLDGMESGITQVARQSQGEYGWLC